ncbi:hypothetical protein CEQ90_19510 [Lewinellaceae bacterium SD302]|nr:hypothetical protein CEQ90_19510 [Lewinellaceae bacterium SD302]
MGVSIREEIILELLSIDDQQLLQRIRAFVREQKPKQSAVLSAVPNVEAVLELAGSISVEDATEMQSIINEEFANIEGEW